MTPFRELPQASDNLLEGSARPLTRTFYPLGFPLQITTNSYEVILAAAESWGQYQPEFDRTALRLRVQVEACREAGRQEPAAPEPVYRLQPGRLLIVSDRRHFAACNLRARTAFCLTSAGAVADRARFRWYFLDAIVYTLLTQQDTVSLHAACVARNGTGFLLVGPSGAGKSSLAFACARAGWSYLSDDATILLQGGRDREALGKPFHFRFRPEAARLFPEVEGHGACIKPNGKPTVEIASSLFPEIATASRCRIGSIVFLNRQAGGYASMVPVPAQHALERLLNDLPDYGPPVRGRHEETLRSLCTAPAHELRYRGFDEALPLLAGLVR